MSADWHVLVVDDGRRHVISSLDEITFNAETRTVTAGHHKFALHGEPGEKPVTTENYHVSHADMIADGSGWIRNSGWSYFASQNFGLLTAKVEVTA